MAAKTKRQDIVSEAEGTALTHGHTNGTTTTRSEGAPENHLEAPEAHPWASSAGIFADDPFWDEMMESIARHRREMDAEYQETE